MAFQFPIPPGYQDYPIWNGNGFIVGSNHMSVLHYTRCEAGWNSELTNFHEKEADGGNHYIDRASRLHAINEIKKYIKPDGVILEIGSSSGYLLRDIKEKFPDNYIIGSDCIPEPLEKIAKFRSDIPLIQMDLVNCPLPDNCVDIVIALNVLEHIEEDEKALRQIYRILKPGGVAVIEVPANQDLYDFYDEELKHFRRYELMDLLKMSENTNFFILKGSHLGFILYPFFFLIKKRNQGKGFRNNDQSMEMLKKQILFGGKIIHPLISYLMKIEIIMSNYCIYPCGIRCIMILQRRCDI